MLRSDSLLATFGRARSVHMIATTRIHFGALLSGVLLIVPEAAGDEPKPPTSQTEAARNAQKIPTKIAGTYPNGELIELRVRDRIAFLIKPTDALDPEKRW